MDRPDPENQGQTDPNAGDHRGQQRCGMAEKPCFQFLWSGHSIDFDYPDGMMRRWLHEENYTDLTLRRYGMIYGLLIPVIRLIRR